LGTVAGVSAVSNRFQPCRVLLMPTVETSTAQTLEANISAAKDAEMYASADTFMALTSLMARLRIDYACCPA
jgi:hypothetical protein